MKTTNETNYTNDKTITKSVEYHLRDGNRIELTVSITPIGSISSISSTQGNELNELNELLDEICDDTYDTITSYRYKWVGFSGFRSFNSSYRNHGLNGNDDGVWSRILE